MNTNKHFWNTLLNLGIALVWLVNGLFCKVLNLVPRHQLIVSRILGAQYAIIATRVIGILEILMVVWILSRIQSRWCAITQMCVVIVMNIIELTLVPDLLLFGRINMVLAILFALIIGINEFMFHQPRIAKSAVADIN